MENQDTRWLQRFDNYKKTIGHLENGLNLGELDIFQRAGLIQFFEMSFELAWKLLKDFLEEQGFQDVKSPRMAIKKAFEIGLIENGHAWLELLMDRNLTAHTYDVEKAAAVEQLIRQKYFVLLKSLEQTFDEKC